MQLKESINNLIVYNIDIGKNDVSISRSPRRRMGNRMEKILSSSKNFRNVLPIVPTWEEYTPVNSDEIIIELDPGMAFGTGTHPTTVMSIQALERTVKKGDSVIDVGTGSGVLSIAAAMLGAEKVKALDLDEVAVQSAKLNLELNKVHDISKCFSKQSA